MAFSTVTLHSRFPLVRKEMEEALARALAATGEKIAERTRAGMQPGHFYETGWAQEHTQYEQLAAAEGQVHIAVPYAALPELGTTHEAPRPVLLPACTRSWPGTLNGYWGQAVKGLQGGRQVLPATPAPGQPQPVVDRPDRAQGSGGGQP